MVIFAATTLEKLKAIPPLFWLKLLGCVAVVVITILVLRKIAQMNKIILVIVLLMGGSFLGFSWIYERNEPAFLTPLVDRIAPFFPAKDSYGSKQKSDPKGVK